MTTTFTKITIALLLSAFVFGVFAYFTSTNIFLNEAYAVTGGSGDCGDCEEPPTGGGGHAGGGESTPAPTCDISTSLSVVRAGDTYRITWQVGSTAAVNVYINDYRVAQNGSATYTFDVHNLVEDFTLRANNAGGSCTDFVEVTKLVETPPVTPVCTISASVSSVVVGGTYTINWNGTPSEASFKLNGSSVADSGSATYTFVGPNKESFTFTGDNGGVTCTKTVEVVVKTPAPTCVISATPTTITAGQGTKLTWTSTNTLYASLDHGIGNIYPNDNRMVYPTVTTTYTMTVENTAGALATCATTVTVTNPTPAPTCDSFTVYPATLPAGGGTATLTWNTTNATFVGISPTVGEVLADDSVNVNVTSDTTYTLEAANISGSDYCSVSIDVVPPVVESISCADNVSFTASDYDINEGDSITLVWNTTGIENVSITGVSSTALDGSEIVSPNTDTTYTLNATANGESIQCPLSVSVDENSGGGGGGSSSPRCDLDLSDEKITAGEEVTLEWNTSNTDEITLQDNHGNIIIESDDNDDLDGSIKIRPMEDTTFTMVAERGSKDDDCKVEIEVEGGVTVTETRVQLPTVAGISLTQVPYTGFDAGPMLTTIFYGLLTIWGLFVAYLVAVRRNKIGGVSFAGAHDHVPYTDLSSDIEAEVSPAASYVASATTETIPDNLPTGIAPIIGYAAAATVAAGALTDGGATEMTELENRAHEAKALFSSDAMRYFIKVSPVETRLSALDALIVKAKNAFPSEDGWLVINLTRLEALLETNNAAISIATEVTAGNGGSLAEAIVTGNVVAAYQLIAHRPMIALADAAAELDAVVRARRGEVVSLSTMLASATTPLSDAQVTAAIKALTSALDGIYTSEEEAVKMAIMKAVKAVA